MKPILSHADGATPVAAWLGKQRSLAASMRTLQARTAGLEAGPRVEQALLQAFRPDRCCPSCWVAEGGEPLSLCPRPIARFTPLAMRLSRFFEIGAYAAVAAAIVVGVFLGTRLLHIARRPQPVQSAAGARKHSAGCAEAGHGRARGTAAATESSAVEPPAAVHNRVQRQPSPAAKPTTVAAQPGPRMIATSDADDGYIALMFCDPLELCAATRRWCGWNCRRQQDRFATADGRRGGWLRRSGTGRPHRQLMQILQGE